MSRSRKKKLGGGNTIAASDKKGKQQAARKMRRIINSLLKLGKDPHPNKKAYYDQWDMPKDGKTYYSEVSNETIRKLKRK